MTRTNKQFFTVLIDKKLQAEKRETLVNKSFGYLGIKYSQQDDDDKTDGVRVWDTDLDSPAFHAGLRPNDIIKSINKKEVKTWEEINEIVTQFLPGEKITVGYKSNFLISDDLQEKEITLGSRSVKIVIDQTQIDFQYNLQFGKVIEIGSIAGQQFPEAKVGDLLIFHHAVEGKPSSDGDMNYNDHHLVTALPDGNEIRVVNFSHEVFGVWKHDDGIIIPYKNYIFCHHHIRKASFQQSNGVWTPDSWEKNADELMTRINEIKEEMDVVKAATILKEKTSEQNYRRKEELGRVLHDLQKESLELTQKMHQKKFVELTVLFINPLTVQELQEDIQAGTNLLSEYSLLYPLDLFGMHYTLLRKDYVEAIVLNQNT